MIRPGEPWGTEVARPLDIAIANSDAAAVRLLQSDEGRPVGLSGGDVHRSLGEPGERDPVLALPVDAVRVECGDGAPHVAIAHVVIRRSWWRGTVIAVMNVDHLGAWNVAPRAHPNDGVVDVVEVSASMSLRDRWAARSRLASGTHLPHPDLAVSRVRERSWRLEDAHEVWIDGVRVGATSWVRVVVEPDAFTLYT